MADLFTGDKVDITVAEGTPIYTVVRGENEMTTESVVISDLKEGDIVSVWLKSGTQEAEYITVGGMGGMGGMGGFGGMRGGQGGQNADSRSGNQSQ